MDHISPSVPTISNIDDLTQFYANQSNFVWKIIEGLVPNFSKPIVCSYSERRGRTCIISHVNLGRLGSLAYNSFRWRAIRLFNAMSKYIRCISSCSVVSFKSKLDCCLKNIVDLPGRPGFRNSLDSGDILQWWTPREDLASNQMLLNNHKYHK